MQNLNIKTKIIPHSLETNGPESKQHLKGQPIICCTNLCGSLKDAMKEQNNQKST